MRHPADALDDRPFRLAAVDQRGEALAAIVDHATAVDGGGAAQQVDGGLDQRRAEDVIGERARPFRCRGRNGCRAWRNGRGRTKSTRDM